MKSPFARPRHFSIGQFEKRVFVSDDAFALAELWYDREWPNAPEAVYSLYNTFRERIAERPKRPNDEEIARLFTHDEKQLIINVIDTITNISPPHSRIYIVLAHHYLEIIKQPAND